MHWNEPQHRTDVRIQTGTSVQQTNPTQSIIDALIRNTLTSREQQYGLQMFSPCVVCVIYGHWCISWLVRRISRKEFWKCNACCQGGNRWHVFLSIHVYITKTQPRHFFLSTANSAVLHWVTKYVPLYQELTIASYRAMLLVFLQCLEENKLTIRHVW